ncbi:Anticodon-binding domain protein [Ostertagia ostertagi]
MSGLETVPDTINFPKEEENTLKSWSENGVFEKSLALAKDRPRYTFFDGPPFATGLPHYGHILAGTIKDVVTRWAHQNGFYVERRFGWDTHGLPVEYEVDKTLGVKGPSDIYAMGIDKYNAECRSIVMRYAHEWEVTVARMGRWIDFRNDYKTLYPWFMESVWWAFSELVKKGLVYRGVKVMPFSTSCNTPLSNFEAGQNYKDVVDPAVCIGFRLDENPNRMMVAWTTTPWTLPSNLALCVHPDLDYVVVKDPTNGLEYVVLEERLFELKNDNLEVLEKVKGRSFEGKTYEPLFPYFTYMKAEMNAFRVLCNTFVTTDQGTGIVHQAPYFGEVDYQNCLENGIITKDMKIICPVDESGRFTDEVSDFAGMYVKDADKPICKRLKESGNLIKQGEVKHSYPFCWRSDTPLLYKAVPSWFIRVEQIVPKLLANNEQTLLGSGQVFSMKEVKSENVMDRWIESFTNSLVQFVRKEMAEYRLYAVVTPLTRFFDTLTNCYIRLNRKRIKGDFGADDQTHALSALGRVLILIVRLMAPFTPFFCEYVWKNLRKVTGAPEESVHYTLLPTSDDSLIDTVVERRVQAMRDCIDLVRVLRERKAIPVKTIVMLDVSEDSSLVEEGLAREITNRVQKLRKAAKLVSTDPAVVYCVVEPKSSQLAAVVTSHKERIEEATGTPLRLEHLPSGKRATVSNVSTVKDSEVSLWLIAERGWCGTLLQSDLKERPSESDGEVSTDNDPLSVGFVERKGVAHSI